MVPFKKHIGIGAAVATFLAMAGFSVAEVGEYLRVDHNRVVSTVRGEIPLSVEIDRMEVPLEKLDTQVNDQKYAVAKSQVALQDAETALQQSQLVNDRLVDDMQQLRNLNASGTSSMYFVAPMHFCGSKYWRATC